MVDPDHPRLSIHRQCELVSISRASFYRQPAGESLENLERTQKQLLQARKLEAIGVIERRRLSSIFQMPSSGSVR